MLKKELKDFKIKDVILEYKIKREDEGIFWAKLDCLIETSTMDKSEDRFMPCIKRNWGNIFDCYEYKFGIIFKYIKSVKLPYMFLKEKEINYIENTNFIENILVSSMIKIIIIQNDNYTEEDIKKELLTKLQGYVEKDYILHELNLTLKKYLCFGNNIDNLRRIFVDFFDTYINIYNIAFDELTKRKKSYKIENKENKANIVDMGGNDMNKNVDELEQLRDKYEFIISNKNTEIEALKNELLETEQRGRESFNYAMTQYRRAIHNLLTLINEDVYGNILDRLFSHVSGRKEMSIDELTMLLQNMFTAFNKFGIKPTKKDMIGEKVTVKAEEIGRYYRLDRDLSKSNAESGTVEFPGWTFREENVFLPLISLDNREEK